MAMAVVWPTLGWIARPAIMSRYTVSDINVFVIRSGTRVTWQDVGGGSNIGRDPYLAWRPMGSL